MNTQKAKSIGSQLAIKSMVIGLVIAQLIMTLIVSSNGGILKGFFWFWEIDFFLNVMFGVFTSLIVSYFIGQFAGKLILINKKNHILIGIGSGILVLLLSSFLSSWLGFFQSGIDNIGKNDDLFFDYILLPVIWVTIFGIIPVIIVGIWFGIQIKKHRQVTDLSRH